jgi:translation initiation factor IF-1
MAKEEAIEFDGVVEEILPGGQFRVKLEGGDRSILVYTAGKMRKNRIRTAVGDRVTVEMTPYDLTRGRLVFRHRGEPVPGAGGVAARRQFRPRR